MICFTVTAGGRSRRAPVIRSPIRMPPPPLKNFRDIVAEAKAEADARELPLRVMFQDEARFGRINDPKRCWSPKRTRPTVGKQIIREYTYAYGAVSPRDGAADFLILPVMTAVAMKVFLDELARRHDGQYILMIYDGAPCHSPGALNIPDTMTVRTLPPYSPQLNPVENIWDDMREKFFANIVFESMDAVENKISEACLHYEGKHGNCPIHHRFPMDC